MKMEFNEIVSEVVSYLTNAWVLVNPILKWLMSIFVYVLFPKEIYVTYATIVGSLVLLDLLTKYYAIAVNNGGFWNSIKIGKLSSQSMWIGTRKKIVSYLLIMIFAGLAYRFEMLQAPAEFIATLAYSVMFFRESQSVVENMLEAGHTEFKWLQILLKRKNKELMESAGIEESELTDESKESKSNEG